MIDVPERTLNLVDSLAQRGAGYHILPAVRGDLLRRPACGANVSTTMRFT